MKKHITPILVTIVLLVACVACQKEDSDGPLYGMWQLLEWRGASGEMMADKDSMIFYSFQLQMALFDKKAGVPLYMMSSTEVSSQEIRVYNPILYKGNGHDSIYSMKVLGRVGVPEDGLMHIEKLSSTELVLSSSTKGTLTFRKY